jgi:hypothetical protein
MRSLTPEQRARWRASVTEWRAANPDRVVEAVEHRAEAERVAALSPRAPLPRLSDEECDEVHARLAELSIERASRHDAHVDLIARTARRLGREVARHERTAEDAARVLEELARRLDPESLVPVALVQHAAAEQTARLDLAVGARDVIEGSSYAVR